MIVHFVVANEEEALLLGVILVYQIEGTGIIARHVACLPIGISKKERTLGANELDGHLMVFSVKITTWELVQK